MSAPQALLGGRYRLVRRIAAGGMGVVWEGWDEVLERPVAIKQLRTEVGVTEAEAERAKNRAMREARITARLHHPHAVPVFDAIKHEGQPCLIMQYLPSTTLSAVLRERGPLPPHEVARIGAQIASALAAAHRLKIVHRDVKPGNILIAEDGEVMISDFGISHAFGDATLTSTGLVHGTPAFLAPEVARGAPSGFPSDVFSLGSTLYAATEGAPPFGLDSNSIALLHKVAAGRFPPPVRSGVLTPLLLEMLASDPDARPSMAEVASRLAELQDAAAAEAKRAERPTLVMPGPSPNAGAAAEADSAPPEPASEQPEQGSVPAAAAGGEVVAEADDVPDNTRVLPAAERVDELRRSGEGAPPPEDQREELEHGIAPVAAGGPVVGGLAIAGSPSTAPIERPAASEEQGRDEHPTGQERAPTAREPAGPAEEKGPEHPEADEPASGQPVSPGAASDVTASGEPSDEPATEGTATDEPLSMGTAADEAPPEGPRPTAALPEEEVAEAAHAGVAAPRGRGRPGTAERHRGERPGTVEPLPWFVESAGPRSPAGAASSVPTAPDRPVAPPAAHAGTGRKKDRRLLGIVAAAVVAAIALIGGSLLLSLLGQGRTGETADPGTTPRTTTAPSSSPSSSTPPPEPSSTPPATPAPSAPAPTEPAAPLPAPTREEQLAQAVTGYYALMPGNRDAAWPLMTADYQTNHAGGRAGYEDFWEDVTSVSVSGVRGIPPDRAEATVSYVFTDGRAVDEVTAYRLVDEGGTLKIAATEVISSVSR